jgi:hypothetical protein
MQGEGELAQAAIFHCRALHILHKYHYFRQDVKNKRLSALRLAGNQNWADIMTKNIQNRGWRNGQRILGDGNLPQAETLGKRWKAG